MTIAQDATAILFALAEHKQGDNDPEQGRYMLDGSELRAATGLQPNQLNDAIEVLEDNGYIELHKFLGTSPYSFGRAGLNARGRLELERVKAAASKNAPEPSKPPQAGRSVYPVGSPYGLTDHDWAGVLADRNATDRLIVCFGLKWDSPRYDTDILVANVATMFQAALDAQAKPGTATLRLDFRKLQGAYGAHLFNEIARDIIASDIAVFDTSDHPPNVMIELGVALTWGVAVLPIRVANSPTTPSDISGHTWVDHSVNGSVWHDPSHNTKLVNMVQLALRKKGLA